MEKFEELLSKLNNLKLTQKHSDWTEDLPDDIWEKYFKGNFTEVAYKVDIYTHRWYETSITVIEIFGKFLGVHHISNLFSESMYYEDCFEQIKFVEMQEINTVSYKQLD